MSQRGVKRLMIYDSPAADRPPVIALPISIHSSFPSSSEASNELALCWQQLVLQLREPRICVLLRWVTPLAPAFRRFASRSAIFDPVFPHRASMSASHKRLTGLPSTHLARLPCNLQSRSRIHTYIFSQVIWKEGCYSFSLARWSRIDLQYCMFDGL